MLAVSSGFTKQKSPRIVVVGAGLAGLTAAYRLHQKDIDVQVYEARGRVGGRILTAILGGNAVELGGSNINDGAEAVNIRRLIEECRLELTEGRVTLGLDYFNGEKLISERHLHEGEFDPEIFRVQLADAVKKSRNMREVLGAILEESDPLYKSLSVRLAAYEGDSPEKLSTINAETLNQMLLGGLSFAHKKSGMEGNYANFARIRGGNALLLERLAGSLGNRVHLNMPLKSVSKSIDGSYNLAFRDGERVKADILLLAIPCSVYADIHFEEDLIPELRLETIQSVHYGVNSKILIPFPRTSSKRISIVNDRTVCFFDVSLDALILYYTGDAARFSAETIVENYWRDRQMLEKEFGEECPPFIAPKVALDESFVAYDGPVGYSWPNDTYAKGSYAYISPGQEVSLTATVQDHGETVKTLFAPIDQTLYFAGEHASVLKDVSGTLEAACESGERAARMIKKSLKGL